MKNNNSFNEAITKQDLKDLRQDINKDFGKLVNNILIQMGNKFGQIDKKFEQVDKRFDQVDKRFDQQDKKIDYKFKEQEEIFNTKFDDKFNQLKRDLLDSNLQIAEELRLSREERAALIYRQSIHSNQLENHDNRISFLEKN